MDSLAQPLAPRRRRARPAEKPKPSQAAERHDAKASLPFIWSNGPVARRARPWRSRATPPPETRCSRRRWTLAPVRQV